MQTITLKVQDSVRDKFLSLLERFSKGEVEIVDENTHQEDLEDEALAKIGEKAYAEFLRGDKQVFTLDEISKKYELN